MASNDPPPPPPPPPPCGKCHGLGQYLDTQINEDGRLTMKTVNCDSC